MSGWEIFAAFVLMSILVPVLRGDLMAGMLVLAERLIQKAAGYLPAEEREFREPEWLGDLDWMAAKGFRLGLLVWALQQFTVSCWRRVATARRGRQKSTMDDATADSDLGAHLYSQEKYDDAIVIYRKVLKINPHDVIARNNLGECFRAKGKLSEAAACFRKGLKVRPKHPVLRHNLKVVLNQLTMAND